MFKEHDVKIFWIPHKPHGEGIDVCLLNRNIWIGFCKFSEDLSEELAIPSAFDLSTHVTVGLSGFLPNLCIVKGESDYSLAPTSGYGAGSQATSPSRPGNSSITIAHLSCPMPSAHPPEKRMIEALGILTNHDYVDQIRIPDLLVNTVNIFLDTV